MIADQDDVLRSLQYRNQGLRLRRLSSFVNKHLLEFDALKSLIKRRHTGSANDVGISQYLFFSLALKVLENFFVALI